MTLLIDQNVPIDSYLKNCLGKTPYEYFSILFLRIFKVEHDENKSFNGLQLERVKWATSTINQIGEYCDSFSIICKEF